MKPRTKKEKFLLELSKKLPPLTEAQIEYPKKHFFKKKGYYWKKGLIWCQCCGEEYTEHKSLLAVSLDVGGEFCPNCGAELHLEHDGNRKKLETNGIMYTVITTIEGYQVFRSFTYDRVNHRGKATEYSFHEVFQTWIDPKGHETILTRYYSRSPFHLTWKYNSGYHIGKHNASYSGYYACTDLFDTTDFYFYPRMKVLPLIKRNGWKNKFAAISGVNIVDLMKSLLANNDMEMLAKTGQIGIMTYWMKHGWFKATDRNRDFFESIRICNRNNYIVKDASLWYDLLDALQFLNLDTHSPHYVCPDNLIEAHDIYVRRMQREKEKEEQRKQREEALQHEQDYIAKKGCYLGVCFGDENFSITVLQSVLEFVEEGKAMHHCVYTNGYYAKDCLILSVKNKESKRLATVELSLKDFKVIQCRAACNADPPRRKEIVELINRNKRLFVKAKKSRKEAVIA